MYESGSSDDGKPRRGWNRKKTVLAATGAAVVATGGAVAAEQGTELFEKTLIQDPITQEYVHEHGWDTRLAIHGLKDSTGTPNPVIAAEIKQGLLEKANQTTASDFVISGYDFSTKKDTREDNVQPSQEAYRTQEQAASDNIYSNYGVDLSRVVYGESSGVVREAQSAAIKNVIHQIANTIGDRGMIDQNLVSLYFRVMAAEVAQKDRGIPTDDYSYTVGSFDYNIRSSLADGEKLSEETVLSWVHEAERLTIALFQGNFDDEKIASSTAAFSNIVKILGSRNAEDGTLDWNNLSKFQEYKCNEYGCNPTMIDPYYLFDLIIETDINFSDFAHFGSVPWYVFSDYLWRVSNEHRKDRDPNAVDPRIYHKTFQVVQDIYSNPLDQYNLYEAIRWSSQGESEIAFLNIVEILSDTYRSSNFDVAALMFDIDSHISSINTDSGEPDLFGLADRIKGYLNIIQEAADRYRIDQKDQALFYRFVRNYVIDAIQDPSSQEEINRFDIGVLANIFNRYIHTIRDQNLSLGGFETSYTNPEAAWAIIDAGVPRYIVDDFSFHSSLSTSDINVFMLTLDEIRNMLPNEKKGEVSGIFSFVVDIYTTTYAGGVHPKTASSLLNWMRDNPDILAQSVKLFDDNPRLYTDLSDIDGYLRQAAFDKARRSVGGPDSAVSIRMEDMNYAVTLMNTILERIPNDAVWDQEMVAYFLYRAAMYHSAQIETRIEISKIPSAEYLGFGYMIPLSEQSLLQSSNAVSIPDGVIRLDNGTVVINPQSSVGSIIFNGNGALTAEEHRELFQTMDVDHISRYGNYDAILIGTDGISVIDPIGEDDTIEDYESHFGDSAEGNPFIVGVSPENANAFFIVTDKEILVFVPDVPVELMSKDDFQDYVTSSLGAEGVQIVPVSISIRANNSQTSVVPPS